MKEYGKMKKFLTILLSLQVVAISGYALTFTDDFDRANLADTGWETFISKPGGSTSIVGNKLVINNGGNEGIGDNFAYIDLGENLTNATVTAIVNFSLNSSVGYYMGINALENDIQEDNDTDYKTTGKGYGVLADFHIDEFIILDQTTTNTRNTSDRLTDTPMGVSGDFTGVDLNMELIYANGSLEARYWAVGEARPDDPTISHTPGVQPQATGTHLFFGITDEGTLSVNDLVVTDGNVVPEPLNFTMLSIAFIGFLFIRKQK